MHRFVNYVKGEHGLEVTAEQVPTMKMSRLVAFGVAIIPLLLVASRSRSFSQDEVDPSPVPNLSPVRVNGTGIYSLEDKIVAVSSQSESQYGYTLKSVQTVQLGDRSFLVGRAVDSGYPNDWTAGRTVWFPVDDIGQLVVFEDMEDFREALKTRTSANESEQIFP